MQVDNRWAQPVAFDLATIPPIESNHRTPIINELVTTDPITIRSSTSPLATAAPSLFPPQRVEPVDMVRQNQQTQQNRNKTGYVQSATTDEHVTISYIKNVPIKRVTHPA